MAAGTDASLHDTNVCPSCHHRGPSPCANCGRSFSSQPITRHRSDPLDKTGPNNARWLSLTTALGPWRHGMGICCPRSTAARCHYQNSTIIRTYTSMPTRITSTRQYGQHPHCVHLLDVDCTPGGTPLIVLPHIKGHVLHDLLQHGALGLHHGQQLAHDLSSALEHCHRRGVIHRDCHPGNIIWSPQGSTLIDFGIAAWLVVVNNKPLLVCCWVHRPSSPLNNNAAQLTPALPLMSTLCARYYAGLGPKLLRWHPHYRRNRSSNKAYIITQTSDQG